MLRPMEGVRTLEAAQFSRVRAAGAVLSDGGVDVIKVSKKTSLFPIMKGPNRGKRSVGLALEKPGASPIAELHFYLGDILIRQERTAEAEAALLEELRAFPQNLRARGALALLYHTGGQSDEASSAVSDLIRAIPTPDGYATAARLLTSFGDRKQAEAVRAEGRRVFAESSKLTRAR